MNSGNFIRVSHGLTFFPLRAQAGASLLEVLISALVLGVGLLGIISLQARALQYNQNAYLYSQAAFLAQDMAERMQANSAGLDYYAMGLQDPSPEVQDDQCIDNNCTPEQLAQWDQSLWRKEVESALPEGESAITRNINAREFVIEISFDDSHGQDAPQRYILVLDVE